MAYTHTNSVQTEHNSVPLRVWAIWLCGALFYFYQFVLRLSMGVMTDHLMSAFNVQACALGIVTSIYYLAYSVMQVPVGMVIDRFGPRRLITGAIAVCVGGIFIFALSTNVIMAGVGRCLMGIGSAFAYVGTLKIATLWFPRDHVGRAIGLTMVFGTLGGVCGGAPLGYLMDFMDWRQAMNLIALVGIGLIVMVWFIIRDRPSDLGYSEKKNVEYVSHNITEGLLKVVRSRQIWLIGVYACLMYIPLSAFADLWSVPFMTEAYQVNRKMAASLTSMILIGVAVGSPITAYFSDKMRQRKPFMIISALGSVITYGLIFYVSDIPLSIMYILMFLGGLFFTGQVLSFVLAGEIMPISSSGVAFGFINMIVMLSGVVLPPLIGWLLEHSWHQAGSVLINNLPAYSVMDFRKALLPIPLLLGLALFITKFIRETLPASAVSDD